MEIVFECLMLMAFIFAMCILIYRLVKHKAENVKNERLFTLTIAIGFAVGAVKELIFPPVRWVLILYTIGTVLACTAVALSFFYHTNEINTQEDSSDE